MPDRDPALHASSFLEALSRAPFSLVLTDPTLEDNPIVYVNDTFTAITGYSRAFAVGRNCRFLQGDEGDQASIDALRKAIREGREIVVDIRNYRPDGELFLNRLMISPLFSETGALIYFLGIQMEIEAHPGDRRTPPKDRDMERALAEIQHRVKNHLAMIVGMIRLQAGGRAEGRPGDFSTLARRVETLQLLYEELSDREGTDRGDEDVALGAYLSRVANAIAHLDGRSGIRVNIEAEKLRVPFPVATQLGLILSEVMTNALQHAFDGREEGLLEVEAKTLTDGTFRLLVADDGVGMPDGLDWPGEGSLGGRIIAQLTEGLEARLSVGSGAVQGTTVTIDVPAPTLAARQPEIA
ncbi:MAG: PAS domain-containing protein [Hasllibacter sp.]